jgi:PAS domain S-box-containing protein
MGATRGLIFILMADPIARRPFDPNPPDDPSRVQPKTLQTAADSTRAFFECVPATVWTTDAKLVLTFVEGVLLRRLKISPDRILGKTLPDLLLDGREDHPLIQGHLTALAGYENVVRIEWAGDIYSARLAPLRDAADHIVGVAGVQQQIGWMPDDDTLLREGDVRLRRAVDANIAGIVFGNEAGEVLDANEAFLELLGLTREDLTTDGISWASLVPVEFHQRQLDAIEELKRNGRCAPFEMELVRRDGRRIQVMVSAARLSARRRQGVAFVVDISTAKRTARHLSLELASADVLLSSPTPDVAASTVLELLCTELGWQGALMWRQAAGHSDTFHARHGVTRGADPVLQEMARTALGDERTLWSAATRTLAVPLANGFVILLVADAAESPENGVISTSRAIGLRLARFLGT